jgi:predicted AAA+ superfamily ATPase
MFSFKGGTGLLFCLRNHKGASIFLHGTRLFYYPTKSGAAIDFIVEMDNTFIPVEVKRTGAKIGDRSIFH